MTLNHTLARNTSSGNNNNVDEYDVIIPTGIGFSVGPSPSEEVEFSEYNWDESGEQLSTELSHSLLFRQAGDVFLEVDGERLDGKPFDEVEALIMDKTKPYHHFRMRTSQQRTPVSPSRSCDTSSFDHIMKNLREEIQTHEDEIKSHKRAVAEHSVQLEQKKDEMKQVQKDELKKRKDGVVELQQQLGIPARTEGEEELMEALPVARPRHNSRKRKSPPMAASPDESKRVKSKNGSWLGYMKSTVGL